MFAFLAVNASVLAFAFREGDNGDAVGVIQKRLVALGYNVTVDNDFGNSTAMAVMKFQKEHGLEVDGLVGSTTYQALVGRSIEDVSRSSFAAGSLRRVTSIALQYQGVPYAYGGTSPSGFDCSGFVRYVYAQCGVSLPRMADEQYSAGTPVNGSQLSPGDLVFFSTYESGISHSGIYLGNGQFVHSSSSHGVRIDSLYSDYWSSAYVAACRVQ